MPTSNRNDLRYPSWTCASAMAEAQGGTIAGLFSDVIKERKTIFVHSGNTVVKLKF